MVENMWLPKLMRAVEIDNGKLSLCDRPVPIPGQGEVLIKVEAAGINRPDVIQRQGHYPPPPGASDIPGLEVAGTIVAMDGNTGLLLNDQVCALVTGGGYAEYCIAQSVLCLPIPAALTTTEAAGIPEAFFTVWSNVFDRGRLEQGETLLVHGGTSGIGTTAIQCAKAFGSKIIVTAGSEKKCRFCLDLGADAAINYQSQDFVAEIARLTQGAGVQMVLDMIGGAYLPRNLKCLAEEGRLVQIAVQQGAKAEINLWTLMQKRITLTGSTLRAREIAFKAEIAKKLNQNVWPLLSSGAITPVIDSVYPLAEAANAHERMESGGHMGKIILKMH
jgi:NADPH:quinone reductase